MEDLKCPVCKHELTIQDKGDFRCPNCYRYWTHEGIRKAENKEDKLKED